MKGSKTTFVCRECGETSMKWLGRCPECLSWNSFDEIEINTKSAKSAEKAIENRAEKFSELKMPTYMRSHTGMEELDRVLGGGLVDGSVVLLSG